LNRAWNFDGVLDGLNKNLAFLLFDGAAAFNLALLGTG
jgi:hypothetical protein